MLFHLNFFVPHPDKDLTVQEGNQLKHYFLIAMMSFGQAHADVCDIVNNQVKAAYQKMVGGMLDGQAKLYDDLDRRTDYFYHGRILST